MKVTILAASKLLSQLIPSPVCFEISWRMFIGTAWRSLPLIWIQTQSMFPLVLYTGYWDIFYYFYLATFSLVLSWVLWPVLDSFCSYIPFFMDHHTRIFYLPIFFSVKFLCKPCSLCSWAVCVQLPLFRAELPEDFPTGLFPTLDPSWSLFPPRSVITGPIRLRVCLEHHHHYLCSGKVTVTTQPI